MLIIGCDFHTRYQRIAMAREETAEVLVERRLDHESGEAHAFYRSLQNLQEPVRAGIEATCPIHWFERLLTELGHELWIGDSGGWPAGGHPQGAAAILTLILSGGGLHFAVFAKGWQFFALPGASYQLQFRKIPRVAPGIERHKTIRLR